MVEQRWRAADDHDVSGAAFSSHESLGNRGAFRAGFLLPGLAELFHPHTKCLRKNGDWSASWLDTCAVFSEECRKPENDVARSVLIAAPLIAMMYIVGTSAVLAYIAPADVDLAATVPQLIQAGFGGDSLGRALTLMVVIAFGISFLA